jgi:EAL domain-containing protein (putative c-di-GMP-specific phosphodiesterase class I)
MIIELSRVITRIVVAQQREWLDQGLVPRVVSLNYSTVQLNDTQYCSYLRDLLETFHVPASLIKVEITESMMLGDRVAAEELVTTLTDMGVSLALDDFGTGFSSFDRLTFDAVGFVKLDKTFVDSFLASDTETVTRNLVQLIHDLGKRVVMEGVETRDQMYACVRLGCDFIQGYYYSKPMAPADVPAWVPQG